jgi:hypothetical protein
LLTIISNNGKVLKCGAEEGWRRSVGYRARNEELIIQNEEVSRIVKEDRNILQTIRRRNAN